MFFTLFGVGVNAYTLAAVLDTLGGIILLGGMVSAVTGSAFKRGAVTGAFSLSLLVTGAFIASYHPNTGFAWSNVIFTPFGFPALGVGGTLVLCMFLVGAIEWFTDEERVKRRAAARAARNEAAQTALHAEVRTVDVSRIEVTGITLGPVGHVRQTGLVGLPGGKGGTTDIIEFGGGWSGRRAA